MASRPLRIIVAFSIAIAVLSWLATPAFAHTLGLSTGKYSGRGAALEVEISFAQRDLAGVCPKLDRDHDGAVSPAELAKNPDCLDLAHGIHVTADGSACVPSPITTDLAEGDAVLMHAQYTCPEAPVRFAVDDVWLSKMPSNHRHVARADGADPHDQVLGPKTHAFEVIGMPASSTSAADPNGASNPAKRSFFELGVFHILYGFDHLVFLFGLLLLPAGLSRATVRSLVWAVTAFSVGHSISLALAITNALTPDAPVVEMLIAASIAFVGAENLIGQGPRRRWLVTLPFGFIHGFGFAGALRGVLPTGFGLPLFTFNAGVEVGQLIALTPMVALLWILQRASVVGVRARRGLSVVVLLGGVALLIARIARPGSI